MLSSRLKQLRQSRGLSQAQLGIAFQVSQQTINNYENGKREPNQEMIFGLADFFNVSIDYLYGRTDDPTPPQKRYAPDYGEKIKELRESKGLTLEELGEKINQNKDNIAKYENGKLEPSFEILEQLARFFNVSLNYLLDCSNNADPDYKNEDIEIEYIPETGKPLLLIIVGKRLSMARKAQNLSLKQVRDMVSIDINLLSKYEKGVIWPSLENIKILANIYKTSTDYLVGDTDNPAPPYQLNKHNFYKYVLSAKTIRDATTRATELLGEDKIDKKTFLHLVELATGKLPGNKSQESHQPVQSVILPETVTLDDEV